MAKYFIASPHTKEECVRALEDTLAQGPQVLAKYEYGCMAGDHTAYAFVDAPNETSARNYVPSSLRAKARFVEVSQFTPEQIKSFHMK